MPFYNVAPYISAAIESAVTQSYRDWELLLIDDGSTDDSAEIAQKFAADDERIRYLRHRNGVNLGASASRNLGLRESRGSLISYIDADDLWFPEKLENQVKLLTKSRHAEMVIGATKYWYSWSGSQKRDRVVLVGAVSDHLYGPGELLPLLYPLGPGAAPSMNTVMHRAELIAKTGGWEEEFRIAYTDQAFLVKAYLHSSVIVSGDVWDLYRQRADSSMHTALSGEGYHQIRRQFLLWFQGYLRKLGLVGSEAWDLVVQAASPYLEKGS